MHWPSPISRQLASEANPDNLLGVTWKWLTHKYLLFTIDYLSPQFSPLSNSYLPPIPGPLFCMYLEVCNYIHVIFFQLKTGGSYSFIFVSRYLLQCFLTKSESQPTYGASLKYEGLYPTPWESSSVRLGGRWTDIFISQKPHRGFWCTAQPENHWLITTLPIQQTLNSY